MTIRKFKNPCIILGFYLYKKFQKKLVVVSMLIKKWINKISFNIFVVVDKPDIVGVVVDKRDIVVGVDMIALDSFEVVAYKHLKI